MIKLQRLIDSKEAMTRLVKCSLPIGITWDLKVFIKKIDIELNTFEEIKNQKIKELGEEVFDESNKSSSIRVKPENIEEFYKIMHELSDKNIDIIIPEIKINILKECNINISVLDLMTLDWLIIE